jgi:hypothetical protein
VLEEKCKILILKTYIDSFNVTRNLKTKFYVQSQLDKLNCLAGLHTKNWIQHGPGQIEILCGTDHGNFNLFFYTS